jgi:hypothetical protein
MLDGCITKHAKGTKRRYEHEKKELVNLDIAIKNMEQRENDLMNEVRTMEQALESLVEMEFENNDAGEDKIVDYNTSCFKPGNNKPKDDKPKDDKPKDDTPNDDTPNDDKPENGNPKDEEFDFE